MANLNIKLVKSLNGRLEKHIATANSLGLRRIGSPTTRRPAARSPRSAICCASKRANKEVPEHESARIISRRRLHPRG